MRKPRSVRPSASRRGAALLIAVVALGVVAVVSVAIVRNCLACRRLLDRRQHEVQAEWLARSGVELAAARLLADPASYKGEAVELIAGAQVRIEVRSDQATPNVFRVTSAARFPRDGPDVVQRSVTRSLRRTPRGDQVRIEVIAEGPPASGSGDASPKP